MDMGIIVNLIADRHLGDGIASDKRPPEDERVLIQTLGAPKEKSNGRKYVFQASYARSRT